MIRMMENGKVVETLRQEICFSALSEGSASQARQVVSIDGHFLVVYWPLEPSLLSLTFLRVQVHQTFDI